MEYICQLKIGVVISFLDLHDFGVGKPTVAAIAAQCHRPAGRYRHRGKVPFGFEQRQIIGRIYLHNLGGKSPRRSALFRASCGITTKRLVAVSNFYYAKHDEQEAA
jgi:hypothetical protein